MADLRVEYSSSWALVIGINKYQNITPLCGAVNDARAVAELLLEEYRFPKDQVILLLDEEATQKSIRQCLEILTQTQPDDRVVFFFAGHGDTRRIHSNTEIGYIATVESEYHNWHTLLKMKDITEYSTIIPAKHIFFAFDACFSGLALKRGLPFAPEADIRRWIADCLTHKARQVITAGLAEQEVDDLTRDGHSVFTYHLLRALQGESAGSEGEITADQVMAYVADAVRKDSRSFQTPAFGDIEDFEPGGNFVFRNPDLHAFKVPSNREEGVNTGICVKRGYRISFLVKGIITYDAGHHFTNPDGVLTTYKGQPLAHAEILKPMIVPHEKAYQTKNSPLNNAGFVGSFIAWVGDRVLETTYYIGENQEIEIEEDGFLHLGVNDAQGTYDDNQGEFEVILRVFS